MVPSSGRRGTPLVSLIVFKPYKSTDLLDSFEVFVQFCHGVIEDLVQFIMSFRVDISDIARCKKEAFAFFAGFISDTQELEVIAV